MDKSPEHEILKCLEDGYPRDLSIEEIAERTGVHRNTVSKYIWGLQKEGKIKISRKIGRATMYIATKK